MRGGGKGGGGVAVRKVYRSVGAADEMRTIACEVGVVKRGCVLCWGRLCAPAGKQQKVEPGERCSFSNDRRENWTRAKEDSRTRPHRAPPAYARTPVRSCSRSSKGRRHPTSRRSSCTSHTRRSTSHSAFPPEVVLSIQLLDFCFAVIVIPSLLNNTLPSGKNPFSRPVILFLRFQRERLAFARAFAPTVGGSVPCLSSAARPAHPPAYPAALPPRRLCCSSPFALKKALLVRRSWRCWRPSRTRLPRLSDYGSPR